jgi:hypothetical protein
MEREQKLQKEINEIIYPNIEDRLVFGCDILTKEDNGVFKRQAEFKIDDRWVSYDNGILHAKNIFCEYEYSLNDLYVLGLPINLERLLLALKIKSINSQFHLSIYEDQIRISLYGKDLNKMSIYLKLNVPFSEYELETQEAIYILFNL